jgi:hypothetical protein
LVTSKDVANTSHPVALGGKDAWMHTRMHH